MALPLALGICFHREFAPPEVIEQARAAEAAGFDKFWVIEDCFFTSGPTLASAALTATDSITVGIGIMPAAARNPAITAMEIATLCGLAPGRLHAGIGHGVTEWMEQIGGRPESPLTLLDETLVAVRRLLRGQEVSVEGRYEQLDAVRLAAPPTPYPLVSAGVRGPKSMAVAGRSADGVVLADYCSPDYVRSCRALLAEHGGRHDHRVTVFASMAVGPDGDAMRWAMAPVAAGPFAEGHASLASLPFYDELAATAAAIGWADTLAAMPAEWWNLIGPIGTPDDAAAYLHAMAEAGADCVTCFPNPEAAVDDIRTFARDVAPLLG